MNNILAVTGLTGKKSGGIAQILSAHKDEVLAKFPGGVRALVRSTSNTAKIDESLLRFEKMCGELKDATFLEQAFQRNTCLMLKIVVHRNYVYFK